MSARLMLPAAGSNMLFFQCQGLVLMSPTIPAAAGPMKLEWHVNGSPSRKKVVSAGPMHTFLEGADDTRIRKEMRSGTLLRFTLDSNVGKASYEFSYEHDGRESFALVLMSPRYGQHTASGAYDYFNSALIKSARGEDAKFTSMFEQAPIALRTGSRLREAWELVPELLDYLNKNRGTVAADQMGEVAFGQYWNRFGDMKDVAKLDAAAYRLRNGSLNDQLDWLGASCRKSGFSGPLP